MVNEPSVGFLDFARTIFAGPTVFSFLLIAGPTSELNCAMAAVVEPVRTLVDVPTKSMPELSMRAASVVPAFAINGGATAFEVKVVVPLTSIFKRSIKVLLEPEVLLNTIEEELASVFATVSIAA
jgi:hypothetical protein